MAERPTCATCPWWIGAGEKMRDCMRFPPLAQAVTRVTADAPDVVSFLPISRADMFCGEHPDMRAWIARRGGA